MFSCLLVLHGLWKFDWSSRSFPVPHSYFALQSHRFNMNTTVDICLSNSSAIFRYQYTQQYWVRLPTVSSRYNSICESSFTCSSEFPAFPPFHICVSHRGHQWWSLDCFKRHIKATTVFSTNNALLFSESAPNPRALLSYLGFWSCTFLRHWFFDLDFAVMKASKIFFVLALTHGIHGLALPRECLFNLRLVISSVHDHPGMLFSHPTSFVNPLGSDGGNASRTRIGPAYDPGVLTRSSRPTFTDLCHCGSYNSRSPSWSNGNSHHRSSCS